MGNQETQNKQFAEYIIRQDDTLSEIVEKFKTNTLFPNEHFEVDKALSYQQVWDLAENKSAGCINSAQNRNRYRKKSYDIYPGEKVKLPYLKKITTILLDLSKPYHLQLEAGNKYIIKQPGYRLIVDAHMHIQSLNATPMPIQWGTAFKGLKEKLPLLAESHIYKTRKDERDTTVAWYTRMLAIKDFGCIGQFSTDIIAKIFLGIAHNEDMKKKLYWLIGENPETSKVTLAEAGDELKLGGLASIRDKEQQNFVQTAAYYFTGDQVNKMNIIMPMDLSFAHFWGNYGIPVNLPNPDGKTFSFINDFLHYVAKPYAYNMYVRTFDIEYEPRVGSKNHFYFDIDLKQKLNHYLYYLRGLYGIEEYLPPFKRETDIEFSFEYERIQKILEPYKQTILSPDGTPRLSGKGIFESESKFENRRQDFRQELAQLQNELKPVILDIEERYNKLLNAKFKHFIEAIPGDNTELFEDYQQQILYTEASAYRAPLEMLGFYHYDPRRYYLDDTDKQKILDELEANHSFFTLPKKSAYIQIGRYPQEMIDIREAPWKIREYFKGVMDGITIKDYRNRLKMISSPNLKRFDEVKRKLFPEGMFLGVKMYAPLGYPGNIYKDNELKRYDHLKELFKLCEKEKIPITVHGSPNGMTIPDGLNYLRYDMNYNRFRIEKDNIDVNRFLGGKDEENRKYEILKAVDYMDYICNRPSVWGEVLTDYPDLKLCLAHFGGMESWKENDLDPKAAETSFDWRGKIIDLMINKKNLYTDISCYVLEEKLPLLIESDFKKITNHNKQQTVRDCYVLMRFGIFDSSIYMPVPGLPVKAEMQAMLILHEYALYHPKDKINKIAKRIAFALTIGNDGDKIKERIMMGSDWYMSEMDMHGTGLYYHNMFKLLREVTKNIENKYDAWHQFAVINPLNFLGFLKEDGNGKPITDTFNGKKIYLLNEEKVDRYIENLKKLPAQKDIDWKTKAEVFDNEISTFKTKVEEKFLSLKKTILYSAEEIKGVDGKLLLTSRS